MNIEQIVETVLLSLVTNWLCFALPIIVSILGWFVFNLSTLIDAKRFFGMDNSGKIHVYISAHEDKQTRTRIVLTAEEAEAVFDFSNLLAIQILRSDIVRDLIMIVLQLVRLDLKFPELVVKASPLHEVSEWPTHNSLILVGGPTRNKLAEYFSAKRAPWFDFDTQRERFFINKGNRAGEDIESSGKCAVINRVIVGNSVVFVVAGFGEVETRQH